jgi:hypothetical protein
MWRLKCNLGYCLNTTGIAQIEGVFEYLLTQGEDVTGGQKSMKRGYGKAKVVPVLN